MSEAVPRGLIFKPDRISLEEGWLTWQIPESSAPANWVRCTDRTLVDFSRIESESAVLKFAQRYGVFGAYPIEDDSPRQPDELRLDQTSGRWAVSGHFARREPVSLWLMLSRQVRAILRVNTGLKGRSRRPLPVVGSDDDWKSIAGDGPPFTEVEDAQFFLLTAVNEWLEVGQVGLRLGIVEWSRKRTAWKAEMHFGRGRYNLFGQLAFQLFLSVAGEDRLYTCSGCRYPYIRLKRAPRAGQDNYCPDCEGLAALRASQRWKEKQKQEGTQNAKDKKTRK
jgi:hypothetical protein